jgi:hypothetical protein
MLKYPKYLYRSDDGVRFKLKSNNKYTIDILNSGLNHEYSFATLKRNGFVDSIGKCKIIKHKNNNDGHGNGDFD